MFELIVPLAIALVLVFDFVNGFNDAANAIATIVATKVLTPIQAVSMASIGNLVGPFFFGVAIAKTVGSGLIDTNTVTMPLIYAALISATIWIVLTTWLGLPISCSHALIGGLVGAALASAGIQAIIFSKLSEVILFIAVAPIIGLAAAYVFACLTLRALRKVPQGTINRYFRKLQLVSAFFYSVTHGTNDAQKGMGIITLILFTSGSIVSFEVPWWVILACALSISLGTILGGWNVVKTLAYKTTKLKPWQGFCAETAGGLALIGTAVAGIPVSTTHVIAGSIVGVGVTQNKRVVSWGVAKKMVWAWILTIPVSMLTGWAIYVLMKTLVRLG